MDAGRGSQVTPNEKSNLRQAIQRVHLAREELACSIVYMRAAHVVPEQLAEAWEHLRALQRVVTALEERWRAVLEGSP